MYYRKLRILFDLPVLSVSSDAISDIISFCRIITVLFTAVLKVATSTGSQRVSLIADKSRGEVTRAEKNRQVMCYW